jgi:hypothetical protein
LSIAETKYMMTLTASILVAIFSNGTIDTFAQSELTMSTQDQVMLPLLPLQHPQPRMENHYL